MEYKIQTYNDVINVVTEDNLDDFLLDFRNVLEEIVKFKKDLAPNERVVGEFTWIDDQINELTFNGIKIETKKS